jgi:hypothetical protein
VTKPKDWKYWLRTLGYPQKKRAPRRNPSGLVAMHGSIASPKLGHIRVISRTGLFLETKERWPIGNIVTMTLQKEGASANDSELEIDVQVRVASHGEDGVGLAFVLPKGLNEALWEHLIDTADTEAESDDVRFIFRMVRAILFLYRLCPSVSSEPIYALTGELDEHRTANMLTIALAAERMLANAHDVDRMRAHPQVVKCVLRDGSWSNDAVSQHMWAGLLVSSCDFEGADDSNKEFAELLVQMTTSQARILIEACKRAIQAGASKAGAPNTAVIITPEEMIQVSGLYDLYRSATDVAYLHGYGLIENNFDFSTHSTKDRFDITPTALGLRLFKVCRGQLINDSGVLS